MTQITELTSVSRGTGSSFVRVGGSSATSEAGRAGSGNGPKERTLGAWHDFQRALLLLDLSAPLQQSTESRCTFIGLSHTRQAQIKLHETIYGSIELNITYSDGSACPRSSPGYYGPSHHFPPETLQLDIELGTSCVPITCSTTERGTLNQTVGGRLAPAPHALG